jgi:hypothetical protein
MAGKIFTSNEQRQLESLARRRGFNTAREYMRALLEQDAQQHGDVVPLDDEPSAEEIRAGIKQGLREALRGEYIPLETLWADDDE